MKQLQRGFTIIELLIATLIFAVIIMVITTAVIRFSKQYYHGVIVNATQDTARTIMDDLTRSVQFNGGNKTDIPNGYCVGTTKRYSFKLNQEVTSSGTLGSSQGRHALIADTNAGCAAANGVITGPTSSLPTSGNARELLGNHMRLAQFAVLPLGVDNSYTVQLKIAYGDDDLLVCNGHPIASDNLATSQSCQQSVKCSIDAGAEYCAVAELTTVIKKRVE